MREKPGILMVLGLCSAMNVLAQEDALAAARSLMRQQRNSEAIAELKGLEARRPGTKGLSRELGIAYYREGEYLEAAKYLAAAWKENPEDRDAVQLLGLSYYSSGRPAKAIPPLEKVREWHPGANIDAIYILGLCYLMAKRYSEARQTFAEMYGVGAESAAAHLVLARMLLRQGFDTVAESEVKAALATEPKLSLAHFTMGEFNVYKGDYAAAIREFELESALNPGCAPALSHLGEVYWRLNRDDEAGKIVERAITLDPSVAEPYVTLGKVLVRQGELATAEKNLVHAIALDASSYTAHYFLGQLYQRLGRAEAAERELRTAARIQQQAGKSARN